MQGYRYDDNRKLNISQQTCRSRTSKEILMSASTTEMNRTSSTPKQRVDPIPFPNETKLHAELGALFNKEFDATGYVEYIKGYYFFRSTKFQPHRKINRSDNPFHGQLYDDIIRKINFKELDEAHQQALFKVGKDEYKIHLALATGYEIPVLKLVFQFFKANPEFLKLLYSLKIAKNPRLNLTGQEFPDIVIYPILGQANAKTLWTNINAFFSTYDVNKLGSGCVPRFSKVENPLITYAQFGGDIKNAMSAEERKKYLTFSQVHFSDAIASEDPHLLISPRQLSACKKVLKFGHAAKKSSFAAIAVTGAAPAASNASGLGAAETVAAATTNTVSIGSSQAKEKLKIEDEQQNSVSESQPTQPLEDLSPTREYPITENAFPVMPIPIRFSASVPLRKRKAEAVVASSAASAPAAAAATPASVRVAATGGQRQAKTKVKDASSFDHEEESATVSDMTQGASKRLKRSHSG